MRSGKRVPPRHRDHSGTLRGFGNIGMKARGTTPGSGMRGSSPVDFQEIPDCVESPHNIPCAQKFNGVFFARDSRFKATNNR